MSSTFSQEQFDSIYPEGIENHYWNHARNQIIFRLLKKHGLIHEKILEIGCGKGIVVDSLKNRKINCWGVEIADVVPVSRVSDHIFMAADAFQLPFDFRQSIDTVLILDVIEHIENPAGFIESIRHSYPRMRCIIVTVPARQELWTNYDEFNGHYRRYDLAGIVRLMQPFFIVREIGYFNHILYPVFRALASGSKKRETVIKAPSGTSLVMHRILSLILQLDYLLVPGRVKGTSAAGVFEVR